MTDTSVELELAPNDYTKVRYPTRPLSTHLCSIGLSSLTIVDLFLCVNYL